MTTEVKEYFTTCFCGNEQKDSDEVTQLKDEDDEDIECEHQYLCSFNCKNNYWGQGRYHYGTCIYCIMEGNKWDEEWDSWGEVAERGAEILCHGIKDSAIFDQPFKSINVIKDMNILDFIKIYQKGFKIGKELRSK